MQTEEDDDSIDDRDLPLESDMDDPDDHLAVEPCAHCGKSISEEAEWCHHCGKYLSREDAPHRPPMWLIIGVAAAALVVTSWILL